MNISSVFKRPREFQSIVAVGLDGRVVKYDPHPAAPRSIVPSKKTDLRPLGFVELHAYKVKIGLIRQLVALVKEQLGTVVFCPMNAGGPSTAKIPRVMLVRDNYELDAGNFYYATDKGVYVGSYKEGDILARGAANTGLSFYVRFNDPSALRRFPELAVAMGLDPNTGVAVGQPEAKDAQKQAEPPQPEARKTLKGASEGLYPCWYRGDLVISISKNLMTERYSVTTQGGHTLAGLNEFGISGDKTPGAEVSFTPPSRLVRVEVWIKNKVRSTKSFYVARGIEYAALGYECPINGKLEKFFQYEGDSLVTCRQQ